VSHGLEGGAWLEQAHPEVAGQVIIDLELAVQTSERLGVESAERVSRGVSSHHDFSHKLRVEVVLHIRQRASERASERERG
jgi:3-dehydroquinate dehydratase